MGEAAQKLLYSIQEYLEIEEKSLERYEYHHGEIYMMAGGTPNHSLLQSNIATALNISLRKGNKPCLTYGSDLKIATSDDEYLYADGVVICGKLEVSAEIKNAATNPVVIVEVLSDSTESYDRGTKFHLYQNLPSFREYLLVSQNKTFVEHYYNPEGIIFWQYRTYQNLEDKIELKSIGCEIELKDIYFGWSK